MVLAEASGVLSDAYHTWASARLTLGGVNTGKTVVDCLALRFAHLQRISLEFTDFCLLCPRVNAAQT